MSTTQQQGTVFSNKSAEHQAVLWMHILSAVGIITAGFGNLAAVILAYIKRGDLVGTVYIDHTKWILRTFWWGLLWTVLASIFMVISALLGPLALIGLLLFAVLSIWFLYRIIKGWVRFSSGKSPYA